MGDGSNTVVNLFFPINNTISVYIRKIQDDFIVKEILKINGLLALEIGNGQYKNVSKILRKNNFIIKHKIKDYGNNIRCVVSRLYN